MDFDDEIFTLKNPVPPKDSIDMTCKLCEK